MKRLVIIALLLHSWCVWSIDLNVNQILCNLTNLSAEQCASLLNEAKKKLRENIPDVSLKDYADGVANSTAFAVAGQGSDYGENFDKAIVTAALGVAIQGDIDELEEDPEEADGLGVGASLAVGFNLKNLDDSKWGPLVLSRLDLFGTLIEYDIKRPFDEVSTDGYLLSGGFFGRYQIIKDEDYIPYHLLDWGGIHVHTGIRYAHMKLEARQDFKEDVYASGIVVGKFNGGRVKLVLDSTTVTVPLEISTFFRIGYLFTLYGGFGADFVSGDSTVTIAANGSGSGGLSILDNDFQLSFDREGSVEGEPRNGAFRGFAGAQFNLPYLRVFIHLNKAVDSDLVGAHTGLKFVF